MQQIGQLINRQGASETNRLTETTLPDSNRRKLLAKVWQMLLSRKLVNDPVESDSYKVFERDMSDLSDQELQHGVRKSKDFIGFFTFPAFREMCKISPDDLGVPDMLTAMREACCAQYPREAQKYSHPIVYLAGCAVGWFEMQNRTEKELIPLFDVAYSQLLRRLINGESLQMPVYKALPESVCVPATEEVARAGINKLKSML